MSFAFSIYAHDFNWPNLEQGSPLTIELTPQNTCQDVILTLQQNFGLSLQLYNPDFQFIDPQTNLYQNEITNVYAVAANNSDQQIQLHIYQDMTTLVTQTQVPPGADLSQILEQLQGQYLQFQLLDINQQLLSNDENYILNDINGYILNLITLPNNLLPNQQPPQKNPFQKPNELSQQNQFSGSQGSQAIEQEAIKRLELFKIINNICITADPNGKFVVYKYHSMKSFIQGILYEHKGKVSNKFGNNNQFEKLGPISFLENENGVVIKWAEGKFSSIRVEQRG